VKNFFSFLFGKGDLTAKINAKNVSWNKVYATSVSSDLFYCGSQLRLNDFRADVFSGAVKADAIFDMQSSKYLHTNINANVENIDITECFAAFDNFGQQTITDKNISGRLKSSFGVRFIYDYDTGVDTKSFLFDGTFSIKNGNLKNIEYLRSIARFTGENDLQNIYFSEIINTLNIKDRTITIPLMHIESDAAIFNLEGTHTFDNYVDYRVNLELSDMLSRNFKKRKNRDAEFGNIVEEQKDRVRLPLHIYGFLGDLKVKYDFKQSRVNFKEKIKDEKERTEEALRQEFSRSPQHEQNVQERRQWKEQEKGKFVFEKEDAAPEKQIEKQTKKQTNKKNQFSIEEED
jgi:hypothetical protein